VAPPRPSLARGRNSIKPAATDFAQLKAARPECGHGRLRHAALPQGRRVLEDFYETVDALLPLLPGRWQPNFRCNDVERWKRQLQFRAGQLDTLTFEYDRRLTLAFIAREIREPESIAKNRVDEAYRNRTREHRPVAAKRVKLPSLAARVNAGR
jgi:hypothetical protein